MANVLIIGGGVSGLSAGIYARLSGHRATILEKHTVAGGNLTGWQRGEYHIDNCIHWLTGTNPQTDTYRMWETLGALGNVDVYQGELLYTCEHQGRRLSLYRDLEKTRAEMLACAPEDEKEICSLVSAVKTMEKLCGIGGKDHCRSITAPELLGRFPLLLKYYNLSLGQLTERFSNPTLRFFLSSFLGDDFGALALVTVFATFCGENGGIPRGGSAAMARRMAERFVTLGGSLRTGIEVKKIVKEGHRAIHAILSDGTALSSDYFILTADPAYAFGSLIEGIMPPTLKKRYQDPRLQRFSCYHCAFACDLDANQLPFRGDLVLEIPSSYRSALQGDRLVLREFSHEPTFSPAGKNILQTMVFCDEDSARRFIALREQNKEQYRREKQEIAAAQIRFLQNSIPSLDGKLFCIDCWTPASYRRYTNAEMGSFMSFLLPRRCLPTRLSNRIPGLDNVILATQWQQNPGGLPIAAEGGRLAIETINKMEAVAVKNKSPRRSPAYGRI